MITLPQLGIATYVLLILGLAVLALVRGYRKGILRKMGGVLGFTFGIVLAYIFAPPMGVWIEGHITLNSDAAINTFGARILACSVIYAVCSALFAFTAPIWRALTVWHRNSLPTALAGAGFTLLQYMTAVSLAMNILMVLSNDKTLMKKGIDNDGNICGAVLALAPAIMGADTAADLSNAIQIREATKISLTPCNIVGRRDV